MSLFNWKTDNLERVVAVYEPMEVTSTAVLSVGKILKLSSRIVQVSVAVQHLHVLVNPTTTCVTLFPAT